VNKFTIYQINKKYRVDTHLIKSLIQRGELLEGKDFDFKL